MLLMFLIIVMSLRRSKIERNEVDGVERRG